MNGTVHGCEDRVSLKSDSKILGDTSSRLTAFELLKIYVMLLDPVGRAQGPPFFVRDMRRVL
jgi:hypothetical protein